MLKNTPNGYGWVSIALHWVMALALLGLFGLGLYMVELTYYDPWYRQSLNWHKSIGILLAVTWLVRVLWRLSNTTPGVIADKRWHVLAAHAAHRLLYRLVLALLVRCYLISTADGPGVALFCWFSVPATVTGDKSQ